ncbi:MAG: helix-turn-helix domain-containing protein [Lewinellaceae bacterium]|nr:helix-turn-helix domain-containing protein [Saprospiraceae bacterium]MCB9341134.1 helix-turn-helix domain-containing protein [Lewinellaceae bacterium]
MEVVCLETKAFYTLIDEVVERMMEQRKEKPKWVSGDDAMEILKITSKTTLQKLKNEGHIKFSQPMKKLVVYDRQSLLDYLEKHSHEPFQ